MDIKSWICKERTTCTSLGYSSKDWEKYNIEWLINQPWNWKTFPDAASHMRYGHGVSWRGLLPGKWWEQALYGTPLWFKLSIFSSSDQLIDGGEFIYEQIKDEDYESSTGIPDIYLRP